MRQYEQDLNDWLEVNEELTLDFSKKEGKYLDYLYSQIENMGYTEEQINKLKEFYDENNEQMENLFNKVSSFKDIDLAHMMLAISVQLDTFPKGLLLELGLNSYRDEYYSWKGDVESGRMEIDDIKADINAFVIVNIYKGNGEFSIYDALSYVNDVKSGEINPVDEFLKIYGGGDIQKGYDEVINQLNDTTSGTVVINEGMKEGAWTEVIDIIPWESLKFENYFKDNLYVQDSYNKFTDYLKNNSSNTNLFSDNELYEN